MKQSNHFLLTFWLCLTATIFIFETPAAKAGWTGSMNGIGIGWANVNATSVTLATNSVNCPSNNLPSASMTNGVATGFRANGPLPDGSSLGTVAQIKGTNGYKWKANTVGVGGDSTDNKYIDKLIKLNPSDCASVELDSSADIAPDGKSGHLKVNTKATPGTAVLLRGYEYKDPTPPSTVDELETNANSDLKWNMLMVGPFDLNDSNCNAVNIQFTLETSVSNLYFVVDGEAKSLPLALYCPTNVTAYCGDTITYPPAYYSACGDVNVKYNPVPGTPLPAGVNPVTITITDQYGNSTNCTFLVTVIDNTPPVVPVLNTITGQCSAQVPTATTVDICGSFTNPVTGTTTDPLSYNTQGTNIVHWMFDDGHGNKSYATQTVIVKDTQAPVPPAVLPDFFASGCSGGGASPTAPYATDNCAGSVQGMTTATFPITSFGTNVITWTFDDHHGNVSSATQNVIVGGLTFAGFYPPIGTLGGTCTSNLVTVNRGSILPIKFDMSCGTNLITSGQPPAVNIQPYNSCTPGADVVETNSVYQNDWHFNWDTSGYAKGVYKVTVVLPDNSKPFVFVKVK
jgi:hypothetical protein